MADQQRVHPVHDPEAPQTPTAPLVPRGSSKSDQGAPAPQDNVYYPPVQRTLPVVHSRPPKRRGSCLCRCFCWTFSFVALLIVLVAITAGILYLAFRPKLPKYSIDALDITQFNLNNNGSLDATFDVNITARNPNKKIGIYYEGGSRITVLYDGQELCRGSLPKFYQGHQNTTVLVVPLSGQTQNATGMVSQLQAEQQANGVVPLNLRVSGGKKSRGREQKRGERRRDPSAKRGRERTEREGAEGKNKKRGDVRKVEEKNEKQEARSRRRSGPKMKKMRGSFA